MESESFKLAKEFLGKDVLVKIDRPLGSIHPKHGFLYEVNYGFVNGVMAPDGEDLDVYVLGVSEPLEEFKGVCIAVAHRKNDDDDNLIVVHKGVSFNKEEIKKLIHFQEQWFDTVIVLWQV